MISSIEITRFRGIREGKLEDLTPLVVMVGPNGCGKSTVLDAVLVGAAPAPGPAICRVVKRHSGVVRGATWLFYRPADQKNAEIAVETATHSRRRCRLARYPTMDESTTKVVCHILPASGGDKSSDKIAVEFRDSEVLRCDDTSVALDGVADVRLVEPQGNSLQEPLHDLYSQARRSGRREDVKGLVVDLLPNVKDIEILTEGEKPLLYFDYADRAVPAALAGDGIHALVRVALELASRPEGVVLLEEPEVHQHPGAIRQSVRAILAAVRRDVQVILTTHSLELIDALVAESSPDDLQRLSLYQLELDNGKLISVRKPGSEVAFARQEIEKDLR